MSNKLLRSKTLGKRFGYTEEGFVDLPGHVSNIMIARIFAETTGEDGYDFPRGIESKTAGWKRNLRSWKHYRHTQYRVVTPDTFCPPIVTENK